ncbi:E3 ubiquitin-protein ligase-like protein [Hapsidospora chrysogenum ATCC 11550]|uniref:RING-type E3 ubiquitin transferase n=1 Tax=Hapsidospora chrysogenum (strain ATCC 11550 / CBS 779.69 / DSM 880 / IAM 14645 / JCM 23072 / IMI 49137) TaxID=857340 RepID=A0A086T1P9_HAPC1|nr:E3 ubiquitin-protein ligase-like protein [Hapsidospora chrysogenum ATCC 11550]
MPKMRLGWYAGVSTALAGSVVLSAFHQRPNFYSAMVYLSQSNFCLLVLVNFTLLLYSSFLYGLTRLCFGRLRAIEIEQLTERAWFAITETCLAMTIFREEIGAWFLVMFTALVSGKVWGWIGDGRVEVLEQQPPSNPRLFHLRLSVSLAFSFIYDILLLRYTVNTVIQQARPNMMVMFLFEFAVLSTSSWRTGMRYLLSLTEQNIIKTQTRKRLAERKREVAEQRDAMIRQREQAAAAGQEAPADQEPLPDPEDVDEMDIEVPGWAAKGEWVLWLDLISDMIKLGIYIAFFFMLIMFYGLPIHIIRDLFMTSRDFLKRLSALLRYRRAIQEMNRYPDATAEELSQENTCIICREEMRPWDPVNNPGAVDRARPKKLPCGHTLHLGCLKSWLERQQVCPTCRSPVTSDRTRPAQAQPGNRRIGLRIQVGGQAQPPAQAAGNAQDRARGLPNPPQDQAQQQQQQQQQQPEAPENRPRIFNLGPLRLGFGANGAQVRELARQFGMQPPAPANQGGAPPPATATTTTTAPRPNPSGDHLQDAATLLQQAEQALQNEMQSLQHRQQELQTSQLLMAELQRLRQRQQHQDSTPTHGQQGGLPYLPVPPSISQNTGAFPHAPFGQLPGMHAFPSAPARINSPILGRHGTSGYTTAIPAGSPDLPEGVVIPPGWSLMPLQRLDNAHAPRQPSPQPGPASTGGEQQSGNNDQESTTGHASHRNPRSNDAHPHPTSSRSAPPPRSHPAPEPTPVVSPSPVAPNWGGSAQLLGSSSGSSGLEVGDSASQANSATTRSQSNDGSSQAARLSEAPNTTEGVSAEKGKAKAVTVEDDTSSSEQDDDDDDE